MSNASVPAIEAKGLSKRFRVGFRMRLVTALQDATFTVPRGCVFGLVGPNGAGKTTTIKILMGLIRATEGSARIDGHPVPELRSRGALGYLPENPSFYDHLAAHEFLAFVGHLYGVDPKTARRRADELLEFVGLGDVGSKPVRKYSKGMVQRLGLAQALVHDPQIVVLDEPQSGLDPIGRKEVKDMIIDLKRRGRTVFFSSHILPDVEDVCDEIALLIKGRVRDKGRIEDLVPANVVTTEVELRGAPAELAARLESMAQLVLPGGDSTVYSFGPAVDVQAVVRDAVGSGAEVLRLMPHREDLETIFVREARVAE